MADVFGDIWKFRTALRQAYYTGKHKPMLAISHSDALDLWDFMRRDRDRRHVASVNTLVTGGLSCEVVKLPPPADLPMPVPGKVWGTVYDVRIYVEETDGG